jgi:hypothetical protein
MLAMLGVGLYFNKNKTAEDFCYEVKKHWHIGLSVGDGRWGGFSIGLGGPRFYNGNIRFLDVIYRIAWCLVVHF